MDALVLNKKYRFITPNNITEKQLDEFINILKDGGETNVNDFSNKLKNKTVLIGLCYIDNELVAGRVIKKPNPNFLLNLFKRADAKELIGIKYELGYSAVKKEWQGQGIYKQFTEEILKHINEPSIICTRSTNYKVQNTFSKFNFTKRGKEFESIIPGKMMVLMSNK